MKLTVMIGCSSKLSSGARVIGISQLLHTALVGIQAGDLKDIRTVVAHWDTTRDVRGNYLAANITLNAP